MYEWKLSSIEETHAHAVKCAQAVCKALSSEQFERFVITLDGDLGAGKTEWVRGFMSALGPHREEDVSSPTYSIVQVYEGEPTVRHLDLYRLSGWDDLEGIGYRDIFYAPGVTLVEWMANIEEAAPSERIEVAIQVISESERKISVTPHSEALTAWAHAVWT